MTQHPYVECIITLVGRAVCGSPAAHIAYTSRTFVTQLVIQIASMTSLGNQGFQLIHMYLQAWAVEGFKCLTVGTSHGIGSIPVASEWAPTYW